MRTWMESCLSKLSRKSDTTAAIHYALARWDAFVCYCDDGRIEIDNSAAERVLRAIALGRKNYLFAGSDRGGERAATFYSLLGSTKLNGLNPEAYLREVLERVADHTVNQLEQLLPWNIGLDPATTALSTYTQLGFVHEKECGHNLVKTVRVPRLRKSAIQPAKMRSPADRVGDRCRERFTIRSWCLRRSDSATTERTPPGPSNRARTAIKWMKRTAKLPVGEW